jgi:nitric oxide reductase NorQ protein
LLHSLTDHRRELYLDKTHEVLRATDSFQVVVSFNPGYQSHFRSLKPSTRQRFVSLEFSYPSESAEAEIIRKESGLDSKRCEILVSLGKRIRNLKDLQMKETVSTRLLIHAAKLMKSELAPRLSCDVGIVQALTDDEATSIALRDLVSLFF